MKSFKDNNDNFEYVFSIVKNFYKDLTLRLHMSYFDYYENNNSLVYKMYVSTNENLYYYYDLASFENRSVLVPTASGDHAFNAYFLGASSVETYDINLLAKYAFNLKETAIKKLSRSEYLDFYSYENFFNLKTYNKLKPFLKKDTAKVFDYIVLYNNKVEQTNNIFEIDCICSKQRLVSLNPYLKSNESFSKIKSILKNKQVDTIHKLCPAHLLYKCFDKKDIVIFSNIFSSYYGFSYETNSFLNNISEVLKPDGVASVNYIYKELNLVSKFLMMRKIYKSLNNVFDIKADKDVVMATRNTESLMEK